MGKKIYKNFFAGKYSKRKGRFEKSQRRKWGKIEHGDQVAERKSTWQQERNRQQTVENRRASKYHFRHGEREREFKRGCSR